MSIAGIYFGCCGTRYPDARGWLPWGECEKHRNPPQLVRVRGRVFRRLRDEERRWSVAGAWTQ